MIIYTSSKSLDMDNREDSLDLPDFSKYLDDLDDPESPSLHSKASDTSIIFKAVHHTDIFDCTGCGLTVEPTSDEMRVLEVSQSTQIPLIFTLYIILHNFPPYYVTFV